MNGIKEALKKSKVYLIFGGALLVLSILLRVAMYLEKEPTAPGDSSEMEIVDMSVSVSCNEKDDDTSYNYVINPKMLSGSNIPAVHIADIAETINSAYQKKDVYGQAVKLVSVWERGTKVNFTVRSIADGVEVNGEYDRRYGITVCE